MNNRSPAKQPSSYDGDCNFCSLWVHRWQHATGDHLDYLPFQDPRVAARFPEVPRGQFETAVQLVETDGRVYGGAEAVFRALAQTRMGIGCSIGMSTRSSSPASPNGATAWSPGIAGSSRP